MQVYARCERPRPFHHGRVKMRMRDRDSVYPAEPFDHRSGRVIERGDAVPEDIAVFRADQKRALPNGKGRGCADADDSVFVFAERIGMTLLERFERGPCLAARRYILPFLLANHAT